MNAVADAYAWWRKALEVGGGRELTREQQTALGVTHEPQAGFYRRALKNDTDLPIAIWQGDDGMVGLAGNRPVNPDDVWTWCCRRPISEEQFRAVAAGEPWPDAPPVAEAKVGHNQPTDPFEALTVEFAGEKEMAERFLKEAISTQEQADQAAVWSKKIAAIAKKATDLHKVEKQPFLDGGRQVDEKWRTLKDDPDALSKRLKRHLDTFLQEQARAERERQEAARREEDRLRREAEEARIAAEKEQAKKVADGISDATAIQQHNERMAEADRLQREADAKAKEAQARNATAGRTGAKVALRTFVSARIVDYEKALNALRTHPEMKALVEQLANRAARAGIEVDGVERFEEQRAA